MRSRIAAAMALIMSFSLIIFAGCSYSLNSATMKFSYSDFDGTETKDITLSPDETNLDFSGWIHIKSGKAEVTVKEKDTGEELFRKEYTAENSGDVAIRLHDLQGKKNLQLELKCEKAKDLTLELNSENRMSTDSHDQPEKDRKLSFQYDFSF